MSEVRCAGHACDPAPGKLRQGGVVKFKASLSYVADVASSESDLSLLYNLL